MIGGGWKRPTLRKCAAPQLFKPQKMVMPLEDAARLLGRSEAQLRRELGLDQDAQPGPLQLAHAVGPDDFGLSEDRPLGSAREPAAGPPCLLGARERASSCRRRHPRPKGEKSDRGQP